MTATQYATTLDRSKSAVKVWHTTDTPPLHRRVPRGKVALRPGWPLTSVLVGYPLWWVLGIGEILTLVAAGLMAVELLRMRRVAVQRGFGVWLLFLAWLVVGVLVLQVDAPGALPGASGARYVIFLYRLGWYLAATVVLLYIYNMRRGLSTVRITRAFGWLFVTVVAGGILGTVMPHLNFSSGLELLLPDRLRSVQFVHDLVHPTVAQLYSVAGTLNPRASAPFAYTNDWGLNFACLLPFFLVSWLGPEAGWRRKVAPYILLIALFPVIATQNRGLWIALTVSAVVVALRAAIFRRVGLGWIFAAGVAFLVLLFLTPAGNIITQRFNNGYSDSGRTSLASETVDSVVSKSAIIGLGTTRKPQGSAYSIAGGDTSTCDLCTPPALGTQGHLWLVIYSTGIGGLVLYLGFFIRQFWRYARVPSPIATLGLSVIATHFATMAFYDTIGMGLLTIFAAVGLMWREPSRPGSREMTTGGSADAPAPTVTGYSRLLRANAGIVALCLALGLGGGFLYRQWQGVQTAAITTLVLPTEPHYPESTTRPQTLDTIAELIKSPKVLAVAGKIIGKPLAPDDRRLFVTAIANTRILQVHFIDPNPQIAGQVSAAAGAALLEEREGLLLQQRQYALSALVQRQRAIMGALTMIEGTSKQSPGASAKLITERQHLIANASSVDGEITRVASAQVTGGAITQRPEARAASGAWLVSLCSGLMIGLAVGVFIAYTRDRTSKRVGRRNPATSLGGLSVLGRLPGTGADVLAVAPKGEAGTRHAEAGPLLALLERMGTSEFLSADTTEPILAAAGALDRAVPPGGFSTNGGSGSASHSNVVLVVGPRTRSRNIGMLRRSLERDGAAVNGVVLVDQKTRGSGESQRRRLRWRVGTTSGESQE